MENETQNHLINQADYKVDRYTCLLRILMAFEVVLVHFGGDLDYNDLSLFGKVFVLLEKSAVPVYILLAFYYSAKRLSESDIKWLMRRLKRLLIPFVTWNVIYTVATIVLRGNITVREILAQLLLGSSEYILPPFWYVTDLVILTLLFFSVFYLCKRNRERLVCLTLLISLAVFAQIENSYYTFFNNFAYEIKYTIGRLIEMIPYSVCGIILYQLSERNILFKYRYVISVFSLFVLVLSQKVHVISDHLGYGGLKLFIISVPLVVVALANKNECCGKVDGIIYYVSKLSFGVYCLHWGVGQIYNRFNNQYNGFTKCVIITLICFSLSYIISCIKSKTIKMLVM